ncbi:caspase, EACC1-associated type [Streptomyces marincola]|uniref:caspase, EACC1-associated type n=1 Tax=Streptomyces marincola TaxID=2878388 RepID=UPI0021F3175E|nr:AAA family ATPase [Streptomyces marincola]
MAGELSAPGARAILIGTGRHAPGSRLAALPAVDRTLDDLAAALREVCGMAAPGQVTRVPGGAGPDEVVAAVEETVQRAAGPVLLYYVGHGLLGPGDDLYLATRRGLSERHVAGAVPYRTVRDLLGEAPHGSIAVLDCCFSGRAGAPRTDGGARRAFASARPRGSFLLTSASHYALSFAPEGERHTAFSGRLLRLLAEGDPAGPPWLTPEALHAALEREFADDGRVRPARRSEGTLGALRLAANRAYPAPARDEEPPADVPCPYPGLEPFRTEDSRHFFGRDELIARLVAAVDRTGPEAGPVVLVGASGSGKSSLLRAGLTAALERRWAARESAAGPALLLPAPGPRPVAALAAAWAEATGREDAEVAAALRAGRFPGPRPGRTAPRLLIVDQFEETFTRCEDDAERAAFVAALTGGGDGPRVVLGLRADHYGSCLAHPALERALNRGQVTVPPMGERELRDAVARPAAAVGLDLQPGLTERLLHDLREGRSGEDAAGPLPFLAHALRETWLRRSGTRLTLAGYEATGGIWRSVATTTERLHEELSPAHRTVLRELLLRMLHVPPDRADARAATRRRVPLAELLDGLPDAAGELRDRLAAARLITVDRDGAQITHEALLRAWPRLRRWIEEDAAALLLRQQVRTAAEDWRASDRDPAYLLRGSRLDAALRLTELPAHEREFLAAGEAARERERRHEKRRITVLRRALAGVAVAACLAVLAAAVAVSQQRDAARQRDHAREQGERADHRAALAEAENLRATDPRTSLERGLDAHALRPSADTRRALYETLAATPYRGSTGIGEEQGHAALAPDGRTLVTAGDSEGLALWDIGPDTARPHAPLRTPLARLPCASYFPDPYLALAGPGGRTLAALCDGSVSVWDLSGLREGAQPRRVASLGVEGAEGVPQTLALSADGTVLAAAGWWSEDPAVAEAERGTLALWDLSDLARPRRLSVTGGVHETDEVALNADGTVLATAARQGRARDPDLPFDTGNVLGGRGVRAWDLTDPARPRPGGLVPGGVRRIALSQDGRTVAAADGRDLVVIDVTTPADPEEERVRRAHDADISGLAFSPDGRRLATGGTEDRAVAVWDLSEPAAPEREARMPGHGPGRYAGPVDIAALAFDPEDGALLSVDTWGDDDLGGGEGRDGVELVRWDLGRLPGPRPLASRVTDGVPDLALTPDGGTLVTLTTERLTLWDLTDPAAPEEIATAPGPGSVVLDTALDAGGALLASAHRDGRVLLWDLSDRRPEVVGAAAGPSDEAALAFAPDAPRLAVLGDVLRVWDVGDPASPAPDLAAQADAAVGPAVAWTPDGRHLLVPDGLGRSRLLDAETGDPLPDDVFVPPPDDHVVRPRAPFALGADGTRLATSAVGPDAEGRERAVTLWDFREAPVTVPAVGGTRWPGNDGPVDLDMAYHSGGALLGVSDAEGRVWLWNVAEPAEAHLATVVEANVHENIAFTPDGRTLVTSNGVGGFFTWDLGAHPEIAADPVGLACRVVGPGPAPQGTGGPGRGLCRDGG